MHCTVSTLVLHCDDLILDFRLDLKDFETWHLRVYYVCVCVCVYVCACECGNFSLIFVDDIDLIADWKSSYKSWQLVLILLTSKQVIGRR